MIVMPLLKKISENHCELLQQKIYANLEQRSLFIVIAMLWTLPEALCFFGVFQIEKSYFCQFTGKETL